MPIDNTPENRATVENALITFETRIREEKATLENDFDKYTKFLSEIVPLYKIYLSGEDLYPNDPKASEDFCQRIRKIADQLEKIGTKFRNQTPNKSLVPSFVRSMERKATETRAAAAKEDATTETNPGVSFMKPGSLRNSI